MLENELTSPITQTVQEGFSAVQTAVPQVKQEIKTYTKAYNPTLFHLIFIGYFLSLFLLNNFPNLTNLTNWTNLQFLWILFKDGFTFFLGGFLGWNLLFLDSVVDNYFTHPENNLHEQAKAVFKQKGILAWFKFFSGREIKEKSTLRSALFQLAWVFLAFFTVTSTLSWLGKGLLMALGLHLLLDQWQWQRKSPLDLNRQLFWQIKRPVSLEEQKNYLLIMTALFLLLTVLV